MENFIKQNTSELKSSEKMNGFNAILDKILKRYKTTTDSCTNYVQAGLSLFKDTKVAPVKVRVSQGNHLGQRRTRNDWY